MTTEKSVCFLYRTKTISAADQAKMERQRDACLQFAEEQGWIPIREFWASEDSEGSAVNRDDPLFELRAGAEKGKFHVLLVSEFARIGRIPLESSFSAGFFERHGVEVWSVNQGHIGELLRK